MASICLMCIVGTFETYDGIKTYIATPTSDYSKNKAIFFISDVFGHGLNNNFVRALFFAAGLELTHMIPTATIFLPFLLTAMWRLAYS